MKIREKLSKLFNTLVETDPVKIEENRKVREAAMIESSKYLPWMMF